MSRQCPEQELRPLARRGFADPQGCQHLYGNLGGKRVTLPASNITLAVALLVLVSASTIFPSTFALGKSPIRVPFAPTTFHGLNAALQWLANNESSDGSFGSYNQHWAAAAAYALWLNNTGSSKANLSFSRLAGQLDSSSSWFWGSYGEADVPGVSLYTLAASGRLQLLQLPTVSSNLLQFQQSSGGFFGYYSTALASSVTSSVDTAEALRGLIIAKAINASSQQSAVNYLFTLQKPDGNFKLTDSKQSDNLYSQGPEPVSITALTLLALRDASYSSSDSHVSKALSFLNSAISKGFTVQANDTTPVYSASLSALAFNAYGRNANALTAIAFILAHQNPDGGFRDSTRGSTGSNALDTAWAAIALQEVRREPFFAALLRPLALMFVAIGIAAIVVIVSLVIFLVLRSRKQVETKPL